MLGVELRERNISHRRLEIVVSREKVSPIFTACAAQAESVQLVLVARPRTTALAATAPSYLHHHRQERLYQARISFKVLGAILKIISYYTSV
jgi:hypothetical protein